MDEDEDNEKENETTLPILGMEEMALSQQADKELHHREHKNLDLSVVEWKNFL